MYSWTAATFIYLEIWTLEMDWFYEDPQSLRLKKNWTRMFFLYDKQCDFILN